MKVSIVTISFNQAEFLESCIRSVLEQDYSEIEYIVVDPGSTDGSREIIEKYRNRIAHVLFDPDRGPADGLNKGFAKASGDIYGYLNSDDLLLPGTISRIAEEFENRPKDGVLSGHGCKIDAKGRVVQKTFSHRFNPVMYVLGACVLVQQSTFFRAQEFRRVGGFNTDNRVSWDGELWFEMALAGVRFNRIHSCLSGFRVHEESITVSGRLAHLEKEVKRRLACRVGISEKNVESGLYQYFYLIKNRLLDPYGTILRIGDGINNAH